MMITSDVIETHSGFYPIGKILINAIRKDEYLAITWRYVNASLGVNPGRPHRSGQWNMECMAGGLQTTAAGMSNIKIRVWHLNFDIGHFYLCAAGAKPRRIIERYAIVLQSVVRAIDKSRPAVYSRAD